MNFTITDERRSWREPGRPFTKARLARNTVTSDALGLPRLDANRPDGPVHRFVQGVVKSTRIVTAGSVAEAKGRLR